MLINNASFEARHTNCRGIIPREGYTLVPLSLYFKGSRVKMAVGLCKGKKNYDKREDIARKDADRAIERAMKERY